MIAVRTQSRSRRSNESSFEPRPPREPSAPSSSGRIAPTAGGRRSEDLSLLRGTDSAVICRYCGKKTSGGWVSGGSCLAFILGVAVGCVSTFLLGLAMAQTNRPEVGWRQPRGQEHVTVGRSLVAGKRRDCGTYYVKPSGSDRFLVACSPDGLEWTIYRVDTENRTVSAGPPVTAAERAAFKFLYQSDP
jgi:hypothetical protein